MKLLKFRIKNYKSIKDSSWCYLASDITTLAGKNESGKTAILQALKDFDLEISTLDSDVSPIDGNGTPSLELVFEVSKPLLDRIANKEEMTINIDARNYISENGVLIIKDGSGIYSLDKGLFEVLDKKNVSAYESRRREFEDIVEELSNIDLLAGINMPDFSSEILVLKNDLERYSDEVRTIINSTKNQDLTKKIKNLLKQLAQINSKNIGDAIIDSLVNSLPNFIFFSDFSDILPFQVSFTEAKKHPTVIQFAKVSDLDLNLITSDIDSQKRRNILSKHSASISGEFLDYWGQDKVKLIAEADGENLRIGITEEGKTDMYRLEQRSKGLQWFVSFFLRLNAKDSNDSILLIDEPGLYLHAKAQKDVLKVLENISKDSQVIISTHSPYLIDAQRLDRVRLVTKNQNNGTKIENKIHKSADTETLTPIITAIGHDISNDFSIAGKKNMILEGISDYYFIQALREYKKMKDLNIIPCAGAPKIHQIVSLLIGWDLQFVILLDYDSQGKRTKKELIDKFNLDQKRIVFVSDKDNYAIEDLFSRDDFNKYVLREKQIENEELLNSKFLKKESLDKVLLAKSFFENVKRDKSKIQLSEHTIEAFDKVISQVTNGFN